MTNLFKRLIIVIAILVFTSACCGKFTRNKCIDVDLVKIEQVIDGLSEKNKIREDQADARKNSLREAWDEYKNGTISCKDFLDKADYLKQP